MQGIPTLLYDAWIGRNAAIHHLTSRCCVPVQPNGPINVPDTSALSRRSTRRSVVFSRSEPPKRDNGLFNLGPRGNLQNCGYRSPRLGRLLFDLVTSDCSAVSFRQDGARSCRDLFLEPGFLNSVGRRRPRIRARSRTRSRTQDT